MTSRSAALFESLGRWLLVGLGPAVGCSADELPPAPVTGAVSFGSDDGASAGSITSSDGSTATSSIATSTADGSDETTVDPSVDPLDDIGAVELVAGGFQRVEGPVWRASEGELLFTDVAADTIHRLVPPDAIDVFRGPTDPPTHANGLALDASGRLLACEHATQRVTRGELGEEIVANLWMGARLNSPNDLVVHGSGSVLFTDPTYGAAPELGGATIELDFRGVYLAPPGGGLELVYGGLVQPNGIALSPAQDVLYVADTEQGAIYTFPLDGAGLPTAAEPSLFTDQAAGADGLEVDTAGNLYVATAAGVLVLDRYGVAWGGIEIPEVTANLEFGGPELRTLYVAATTGLYRVEMVVPGLE